MPQEERYFSAPGRIEIGGNHTDHQHGRVLAAAVDLETTASAAPNGLGIIRLCSDGFPPLEVDLRFLNPQPEENGTPAAIVRGVAAWFHKNGYAIGGFDAGVSSTIPVGTGLSSSASFEVLIGDILKELYGADVSEIEIAQAGQFAENVYFGKPSGLMDQAASSFGGLNIIDFSDPENPVITPVKADFSGYSLCVVNTGGSHADLTQHYTAITDDMKAVAAHFGCKYLGELGPDEFFSSIGALRYLGDRALLRAFHFFGENERVLMQAAALERRDMKTFFELVIESGRSSLAYLQNVYDPADPQKQGLTLALALASRILEGCGAWRVHGGGFAGTILAFVPDDLKDTFSLQMSNAFGESSCRFLNIRSRNNRI